MNAEERIQRAFVAWCILALPDDVLWFSIPNEGKRSPSYGARLKAMGLRPGAPDFEVIYRGRALFIEFKAPAGRQSPSQRQFEADCVTAGASYYLARSEREASAWLRSMGVPTREKQ